MFNVFFNYSGSYDSILVIALCLCVFIPVWVFFMLVWQMFSYDGIVSVERNNDILELMWTFIPSLIIFSFALLNINCSSQDQLLYYDGLSSSIKVVGHQWYWSYEYSMGGLYQEYDSLMGDLINGVDKPLRLVYNVPYQLLVTSADVIHSFSVPDLGIKVDAVPGRINELNFIPDRFGIFIGYCTELCGAGHAFMPVVVEVIDWLPQEVLVPEEEVVVKQTTSDGYDLLTVIGLGLYMIGFLRTISDGLTLCYIGVYIWLYGF